jgi:hypothetical protein
MNETTLQSQHFATLWIETGANNPGRMLETY